MINKRLQELRAKHHYTQKVVGDLLNMTPEGYGHYESGKRKPSPEAIASLARFYNVSADYLLGNSDDPELPGAKKASPGFITPEDVMEMAERHKGGPLTADERAELLIRAQDLKATILRLIQESEQGTSR
jgi:transcriptional regulator with XRE-family HTH domain